MLITVFDIKNIVHFEFIPQGKTVNYVYYVEILKRFCEVWLEKGLNFGPTIGFSTVTMLQRAMCFLSSTLFWPKNRLLKWNTYPIRTSGRFQK
jgi:hypothetical protein